MSLAGGPYGSVFRHGLHPSVSSFSTRLGQRPICRRFGMAPARREAPCQGSPRPLENPDLRGRLCAVEASMRRASSTVPSTAKVSRLMSNTCSLRCCAPATSLSWITSARTKAARSPAPFAAGAHLLFLPPCSPDLNPIEQVFQNSRHRRGHDYASGLFVVS
jgi:hypothetical protein